MANVKELNINSTTYDIVGKAVVDENNAGTPVKTWTGTSSDLPVSPSADTLYYVTDKKQILLGNTILSDGLKKTYDLFDFKWTDHELTDQSWLNAGMFSWQDGTVYSDAYNHLVTDNSGGTAQTETIGSYTISYVLADDGHKITTDETTVANIYAESGVAWYYVLDTTNQRFKLPRTKFGFTGYRDEVGKYVEAGLPNIVGNFDSAGFVDSSFTGCFAKEGEANDRNIGGGNTFGWKRVGFAASLSSSIYGNGTTVQPPATQMYLYFYVGEYSQSATEQTAGLNASLFNGKVDLNAQNLSNAGKSLIAGLGMPSDTYEDLTLLASGSTYTAPANGYFVLCKITSANNQYINIAVLKDGETTLSEATQEYTVISHVSIYGNGLGVMAPVKKGKVVSVGYTAGGATVHFRFIYAVGSESEAS